MRLILTASVFLALAAAGRADSLPPSFEEAGLAWRHPPSLEDVQRRFPYKAINFSIWKGYALVACTPNAKGELKCKAVEEKPEGYGFGNAGAIVMNRARVRTIDGTSPEGRTFRYGVKFGRWDTPERYQPKGLQWALMPSFAGWPLTGMKMGDVWTAEFSCVAHGSGALDCTLRAARPDNASFRDAATRAMNNAKVAGLKGEAPAEGARFDYTLKVMRLNWCGTGTYSVAGDGASKTANGSVCAAAIALTQ